MKYRLQNEVAVQIIASQFERPMARLEKCSDNDEGWRISLGRKSAKKKKRMDEEEEKMGHNS